MRFFIYKNPKTRTMKKSIRYVFIILLMNIILFSFNNCDDLIDPQKEPKEEDPEEQAIPTDQGTGNMVKEEKESLSEIPRDLTLVTMEDAENTSSGSSVSLEKYLPPIKSQGPYGTCTAWGAGYYTRTIMYARENNLTPADLEDKTSQFSPKYLFLAIPDKHKGDNCNGSYPGAAFEVMQKRGIATWDKVPYADLGNCSESITSDWDANAAKYKIESYRTIGNKEFTVETFKSYLAMGRPVQISCELGLNFKDINSEGVFTAANADYTSKPESHGYHAMALIGYDDERGPNGAFLIVNSWGKDWGDNGLAWIDYELFIDKFCYAAYVIESDKGGLAEDMIDQNVVNPNLRVEGQDLISIRFTDEVDPEGSSSLSRLLTYNVFNKGEETINASEDWNIVYYYYNAYNPSDDYGVIIYDYYTDDVGDTYKGQNGDFDNVDVEMNTYGQFNWWNYVDVPSGYSVAKAVYDDGYDYDFEFSYEMPELTGEHYFVLMADGFNDLDEQYEQNNYIFLTGKNKEPLTLKNGLVQDDLTAKSQLEKEPRHYGALEGYQPNTYSLQELNALIKYQKRSGELEEKAREFLKKRKNKSGKKPAKRVVPAKLPRIM